MGKKTPWFGATQKPVRNGVYETEYIDEDTGKFYSKGYSKWLGDKWSLQWDSKSIAERETMGGGQSKRWRGFTTDQNPPATST